MSNKGGPVKFQLKLDRLREQLDEARAETEKLRTQVHEHELTIETLEAGVDNRQFGIEIAVLLREHVDVFGYRYLPLSLQLALDDVNRLFGRPLLSPHISST